jgi:integrase/recombinase XerD
LGAWRSGMEPVMDEHDSGQDAAVRWERYPIVAVTAPARAFVLRLLRLGRSPKTVDAYARNLDRFLACFTDRSGEPWLEADEGEILTALEVVRRGRQTGSLRRSQRHLPDNVVPFSKGQLSDATIGQYVVTLRQFYDFLIRTHRRRDGVNPVLRGHRGNARSKPARGLPTVRRLPWIAPAEVWERIVLHVVSQECARNRAMILVAYDGALRREELVRLCADDYDRARALLKVRAETSKSGRDRWVPLSPIGQRALDVYLDRQRRALMAALGLDAHGALFVSESTRNPGQPLAPGAFNDVISALRVTLALPQLHPHTFRHQRLTALKAAGVPLEDIALFAGHASTETTRLYLHLAPVELGARIRAATRVLDARMERLLDEQLRPRGRDGH